jgi:hypothetical protein
MTFVDSARLMFPSTRTGCCCSVAGGNGDDAALNPGAENGVVNESFLVKAKPLFISFPIQFQKGML